MLFAMRLIAAIAVVSAVTMAAFVATSGSATASRCRTTQLRLSLVRSEGATSHRYWDLALQNHGAVTCRLQGYPGVGLLGRRGGLLRVGVARVPGYARPAVDVRPGARAYFTFGYVVGGPCIPHTFKAYGLQVIPPDEHAHLVLRIAGFSVCDASVGGSPVVYPLRPTLTGP